MMYPSISTYENRKTEASATVLRTAALKQVKLEIVSWYNGSSCFDIFTLCQELN